MTIWNRKKNSSKNQPSLKSPLQRVAKFKISPSVRQTQPVEPKSPSAEFDQNENHAKCQTKRANLAKVMNWHL